MAKYHPTKKPSLYKALIKKKLRKTQDYLNRRKVVVLVVAIIALLAISGLAVWLLSPEPKKAPVPAIDTNPFANLPTAAETEKQVKQLNLSGKDKKLSELGVGFTYMYRKDYVKSEAIGRQYLEDQDAEVKQRAQCLLALTYQLGNVQSLKPFEETCKDDYQGE